MPLERWKKHYADEHGWASFYITATEAEVKRVRAWARDPMTQPLHRMMLQVQFLGENGLAVVAFENTTDAFRFRLTFDCKDRVTTRKTKWAVRRAKLVDENSES